MMGQKHREQASLFYEFRLDDMIPKGHLLRRINVFVTSVLGDLHEQLGPFYSDIGRPSGTARWKGDAGNRGRPVRSEVAASGSFRLVVAAVHIRVRAN
jgi:hypothetical protein